LNIFENFNNVDYTGQYVGSSHILAVLIFLVDSLAYCTFPLADVAPCVWDLFFSDAEVELVGFTTLGR